MVQNLPAVPNLKPNVQNKALQNNHKFFPTPAFNFAAPAKISVLKNPEPAKICTFDNQKDSFQRTLSFGDI